MISVPNIEHIGGLYRLQWIDEKVTVEIDRVAEHGDDIKCQLTALSNKNGHPLFLSQFNYNMTSLLARDKAAKFLKERYDVDWPLILERANYEVLGAIREGEPSVDLALDCVAKPLEWLLEPIIPKGLPTMIFADGGTGKSYISLILAMIVGFPWVENPLGLTAPAKSIRTLLLDWETSKDTVVNRINRICTGMSEPRPPITYRRCTRSLPADMAAIQKHLLASGAELLIIDSLGLACGGDLKEQVQATMFFQCLRELNVTSLLLTHVAKDELRQRKTAFGSIYFQNCSRSVWELSKTQDIGAESINVGLFHRKQNETALLPPIGLQLAFNNAANTTAFSRIDVKNDPQLRKQLKLKEQITGILSKGLMTVKDICEELEVSDADDPKEQKKVETTLYRGRKKDLFYKKGDLWGLLDKKHDDQQPVSKKATLPKFGGAANDD